MKKALQILNTGIDALQKSILFSEDENYKEMVAAEIAEYQEALAELEVLENRSCSNCEYGFDWTSPQGRVLLICGCKHSSCNSLYTYKDYCCNRFEAKAKQC